MSSDLNQLVQGIVSLREASLAEFMQDKANLEKIRSSLDKVKNSEVRRKAEFSDKFNRIQFTTMEKALRAADEKLLLALSRLARKNISIAVAGGARQGKSQILQMLTGLTDKQIPTGDGGFCTATRSEIINDMESPAKALVYFFTEQEMMEKKVLPFYQTGEKGCALGLLPVPTSLDDFIDSALPALSDAHKNPSQFKFYDILQELHNGLQDDEVRRLVGQQPKRISIDDLRPYVTKDDANAVKYFNVVKKVEVTTPFDIGLPNGMKVFDLPGLGEMSTNIREEMLRTVREDADIVLLLRRPDPNGDDWKESDYEVLDALKGVFAGTSDFQPSDWVALVLNEDRRVGRENGKNINNMLRNPPEGFQPIICDCGDKENVREVIVSNMEMLLQNAKKIDNIRIEDARKAYNEVIQGCKGVKDKLESIYSDFVASKTNINEADLFEQFCGELRGPFKVSAEQQLNDLNLKARAILQQTFGEIYTNMSNEYKERQGDIRKEFPTSFPVFTIARLENMFKGSEGPDGPCEQGVRNQLWAILNLFHEGMSRCCEKVREQYFICVANLVVDKNPAITKLVNTESGMEVARAEDKLRKLAEVMKRKNALRDVHNILSALENLLSVQMSYEGHILPYFHENKGLTPFDPYYRGEDGKSGNTELEEIMGRVKAEGTNYRRQAEHLFKWLKEKTEIVLGRSEASTAIFEGIANNMFRTFKANYKNFALQFIWGKNIKDEWRMFTTANKTSLWRDVYSERAKQDELSSKLEALVNTFAEVIKDAMPNP